MGLRATLHIGTEKSGTTSIQRALEDYAADLAAAGTTIGSRMGHPVAWRLEIASFGMERIRKVKQQNLPRNPKELEEFRTEVAADLSAEVAGLSVGTNHVVYSNERFQARLTEVSEVERLEGLLRPHFEQIDVIVYLRRQDKAAVSRYSTAVRSGHTKPFGFHKKVTPFYDYAGLLDRWAGVFGEDNITPRIFEPNAFVDNSLLADFVAACDIDVATSAWVERRANRSISPEAIEYLRRMNRALAQHPGRPPAKLRRLMGRAVARNAPGTGPVYSADQAQAFMNLFAESNEQIRQHWFPDRPTLFDMSTDSFGSPSEASPLSVEQAVEFSATAMMAVTGGWPAENDPA